MPFIKGNSGNADGRPPGAVNKTTKELRDLFQRILEKNLKSIETDLRKLKPDNRIKLLLHLAEFILPKCQRMEVSGIDEKPLQPILSDEQFAILVNKMNHKRKSRDNCN